MFAFSCDDTTYKLLRNPVARDLWWLISSAPLLSEVKRFPQLQPAEHTALRKGMDSAVMALDAMDTSQACAEVGVSGWRVGMYFEALVAYWVTHLPGMDLLGSNVAVLQDKKTLGAFDFIVRNFNGEVEHWEVAVKFYLLLGDRSDWRSWVGPNQRDRLDKKVNRMRDHQLVLSQRKEGIQALANLGVNQLSRRLAILKGCFFTEWGAPDDGPDHSQCAAEGRWVDEPKFKALGAAFPNSRWVKREKPFWLAPVRFEEAEDQSLQLPQGVPRPEMWSRLEQGGDGAWDEAQRWFLVPQSWRSGGGG